MPLSFAGLSRPGSGAESSSDRSASGGLTTGTWSFQGLSRQADEPNRTSPRIGNAAELSRAGRAARLDRDEDREPERGTFMGGVGPTRASSRAASRLHRQRETRTVLPADPIWQLAPYQGVGGWEPHVPDRTWGGVAGDVGITALRGAIGVPEAAVGLAELAQRGLGIGGRPVGAMLEDVGFRPAEAKDILSSYYTPATQAAQREFDEAQGVGGKALAALQNPSIVARSVGESLPMMLAGGVAGRAITAATGLPAVASGAIGEGLMGAGSAAEQTRQETGDLTLRQAGLAGATGVLTGGLTMLGGRVAQQLGFVDLDTMLAGGAADAVTGKHVVRAVVEGAASEGLLEELPQSVQETILGNAAVGRDLMDGVDSAAVLGALSGAAMGGGAQTFGMGALSRSQPAAEPGASPIPRGVGAEAPPAPVVSPLESGNGLQRAAEGAREGISGAGLSFEGLVPADAPVPAEGVPPVRSPAPPPSVAPAPSPEVQTSREKIPARAARPARPLNRDYQVDPRRASVRAPEVDVGDVGNAEADELQRVVDEMETFRFVKRTWDDEGGVAGAGGAPVYYDIVGGNAEGLKPAFHYTRGEVLEKIKQFMTEGKRSVVSDLAMDVVRKRLAGDPNVSRPSLPPEAADYRVDEQGYEDDEGAVDFPFGDAAAPAMLRQQRSQQQLFDLGEGATGRDTRFEVPFSLTGDVARPAPGRQGWLLSGVAPTARPSDQRVFHAPERSGIRTPQVGTAEESQQDEVRRRAREVVNRVDLDPETAPVADVRRASRELQRQIRTHQLLVERGDVEYDAELVNTLQVDADRFRQISDDRDTGLRDKRERILMRVQDDPEAASAADRATAADELEAMARDEMAGRNGMRPDQQLADLMRREAAQYREAAAPSPEAPATPAATPAPAEVDVGDRDRAGKVGRTRPKVAHSFSPAIKGPSGSQLLRYQWAYTYDEREVAGEVRPVRVSDWDESVESDESGRRVVHQFDVERPDGAIITTSLEGAMRELGYLDRGSGKPVRSLATALKSQAQATMARDAAQAELDQADAAFGDWILGVTVPPAEYQRAGADHPVMKQGIPFVQIDDMAPVRVWRDGEEGGIEEAKERAISRWLDRQWQRDHGQPDRRPRLRSELIDLNRRVEQAEKRVEKATEVAAKPEPGRAKPPTRQTRRRGEWTQGVAPSIRAAEEKIATDAVELGRRAVAIAGEVESPYAHKAPVATIFDSYVARHGTDEFSDDDAGLEAFKSALMRASARGHLSLLPLDDPRGLAEDVRARSEIGTRTRPLHFIGRADGPVSARRQPEPEPEPARAKAKPDELDPDELIDYGIAMLEREPDTAMWTQRMIDTFGLAVRPHLERVLDNARAEAVTATPEQFAAAERKLAAYEREHPAPKAERRRPAPDDGPFVPTEEDARRVRDDVVTMAASMQPSSPEWRAQMVKRFGRYVEPYLDQLKAMAIDRLTNQPGRVRREMGRGLGAEVLRATRKSTGVREWQHGAGLYVREAFLADERSQAAADRSVRESAMNAEREARDEQQAARDLASRRAAIKAKAEAPKRVGRLRRGDLPVSTRDSGMVDVPGLVGPSGLVGMHRALGQGKGWVVTHVPSGMALGDARSQRAAEAMVLAADRLGDWQFGKPGRIEQADLKQPALRAYGRLVRPLVAEYQAGDLKLDEFVRRVQEVTVEPSGPDAGAAPDQSGAEAELLVRDARRVRETLDRTLQAGREVVAFSELGDQLGVPMSRLSEIAFAMRDQGIHLHGYDDPAGLSPVDRETTLISEPSEPGSGFHWKGRSYYIGISTQPARGPSGRERPPVPPGPDSGSAPGAPAAPGREASAGKPYSREAMAEAFNLSRDEAAAVDMLVDAMGLDMSRVRVARSHASDVGSPEARVDFEAPLHEQALAAATAVAQRTGRRTPLIAHVWDEYRAQGGQQGIGEFKQNLLRASQRRELYLATADMQGAIRKAGDGPALDRGRITVSDPFGETVYDQVRIPQDRFRRATGEGRLQQAGEFATARKPRGPRLSAIHQLSGRNLEFADRMGGLAVPSIAVVPEGSGAFRGFGDITLIGTRSMGDPERVPVVDSDVYSARFPRAKYGRAKPKEVERIVERFDAAAREFGDDGFSGQMWEFMDYSIDPEKATALMANSLGVRAAYLREHGVDVQPVMQRPTLREPAVRQPAFRRFVKTHGINVNFTRGDDYHRALTDAFARASEQGDPDWNDEYRQVWRDAYINPDDGLVFFAIADRILRDASRAKGPNEVNTIKTSSRIRRGMKGREAAFKSWVDEQITAALPEPHLMLGNRKVPYTIENIAKKMSAQSVRGAEKTMAFGEGAARAAASKRFRSLESMRTAAADQIKGEDEINEARERSKKLTEEWRDRVFQSFTGTNYRGEIDTWEALDSSMRALSRWATSERTESSMRAALRAEGFDGVSDEDVAFGVKAGEAMMLAPVPYFEAKPKRVVRLSEFAGAVVPRDASPATRRILERAGMAVELYSPAGDGIKARSRALNKLRNRLAKQRDDVLFQSPDYAAAKGEVEFAEDGETVVRGFAAADVSTALHEIVGHVGRRQLINRHVPAEQRRGISDGDVEAVERWAGARNGEWSRDAEERFARGFERYLRAGKAPSERLAGVFAQIREWLRDIYKRIRGSEIDVQVSPEVRAVFDKMLTRGERVETGTDANVQGSAYDRLELDARRRARGENVLFQREGDEGGQQPEIPFEQVENDFVILGTVRMVRGMRTRSAWDQSMVEEFGERVRPRLDRLWQQSQERFNRLGEIDEDDYFNFRRVAVGEAERAALRDAVVETVVRTGRSPKEVESQQTIRDEARELHPSAVDLLAPFQRAQAPYRAVRMAARQRINALNREIIAARREIDGLAEDSRELRVAEGALVQKEADLKALMDTWMRMRSEDGRNLAMHRMMADSTWENGRGFDHAYWLSRARRAAGLPPRVDLPLKVRQQLEDILQRGDEAARTGANAVEIQQELADFMKDLDRTGVLEAINLFRKANLLTGIKTHLRNLGGNLSFQVLEEASRLPASMIDIAMSGISGRRTVQGVSPLAVARSTREAATRGVREAVEVMRTGQTADELMKAGAKREANTGLRWLDAEINFNFRLLGAEDRLFKSFAFRRSLEEQAKLEAVNTGVSPVEILSNPTEAMLLEAAYAAEFATFNNPSTLGRGWRSMLATWGRQGTAGRALEFGADLMVPYVNTPSNILARLLDYTPAGGGVRAGAAVTRMVRGSMTDADQRAFSLAIGRGAVGTAIAFVGWKLAAAGLAVGLGYGGPGDEAVERAAGRMAGSVLWNGRWRLVAPFTPAGHLLALGATIHEEGSRKLSDEAKRVTRYVTIGSQLVMEQPMLKGVKDTIEALRYTDSTGERLLASTAGSFVPTIVSDVAGLYDPYRRDARPSSTTDALWKGVAARLPGVRNNLPEMVDVFGRRQVQNTHVMWDPAISPVARELDDKVIAELLRHQVGVAWPSKKRGEDPDAHRARARIVGKSVEMVLRRVVYSASYDRLSPEQQEGLLEEAVQRARARVRNVHPDMYRSVEHTLDAQLAAAGAR